MKTTSAPLQGAFVWGLFGDASVSSAGGGSEATAAAATAAAGAATVAADGDVSFDNDALFVLLMIRRINSM